MTFKELQALLLGYRAADPETRARILRLVPDLRELVDDVDDNSTVVWLDRETLDQ